MTAAEHAHFRAEALPWLDEIARYAMWLTGNAADADDLTQETFLRAFRGWRTFRAGESCRPWLVTICRNIFLRHRRREQRVVTVEDPELEALAAASLHRSAREQGAQDLFTMVDFGDAVAEALRELPEAFREALVLVDIQDLSYADAAAALDIPLGTLRSRLFRARRQLQEDLMAFAKDAGYSVTASVPGERKGGTRAG
ncbi:MAG: sigma-70 family RNA polymerase sigma factor [Gemmatimonadota bacterium]|nr:sigma-70 family RNA polymerase sigma factor [Gemmatimonadota bacterium]